MSFAREIPTLQTLCLRNITPKSFTHEITFSNSSNKKQQDKNKNTTPLLNSLRQLPSRPYPFHPNATINIDICSPWIAARRDKSLIIQNSNAALDMLQRLIDTLIETGHMDDDRLGLDFFRQWNHCCSITKKRKLTSRKLFSLSFHNASNIASITIGNMIEAGVGPHLGVLDLTSMSSLSDEVMVEIVKGCPYIHRLCIKNCRKVTGKSIKILETGLVHLQAINVGGCFNIHPEDIISLFTNHTNTSNETFYECHVNGLSWDDTTLSQLSPSSSSLKALSIGFASQVTSHGILDILSNTNHLQSLAVPFIESLDTHDLAEIGKLCPHLSVLDIRGCVGIDSINSFLEARVDHFDENEDSLFILARYSSVTPSSLEESRSLFQEEFTCVIDGGGFGGAVRRSDPWVVEIPGDVVL